MRQILWIPFTLDRAAYTPTEAWVRERIAVFHDFTLRSLLVQTRQDFDIHVICGQRHRAITEEAEWHSRVTVIHDQGVAFANEMVQRGEDFLSFTRIDSDDLLRIDGIERIMEHSSRLRNPDEVSGHVSTYSRLWDRIGWFVGWHGFKDMRRLPPFVTKIFPLKVYRNIGEFGRLLFLGVGSATQQEFSPVNTEQGLFCVVKHTANTSMVRRDMAPTPRAEVEREGLVETDDLGEMTRVLAEYGMPPEMVECRVPPVPDWTKKETLDVRLYA